MEENCRHLEKLDNCNVEGKVTETVEENCRNQENVNNNNIGGKVTETGKTVDV